MGKRERKRGHAEIGIVQNVQFLREHQVERGLDVERHLDEPIDCLANRFRDRVVRSARPAMPLSFPIVDLGKFEAAGAQQRRVLAQQVDEICRATGATRGRFALPRSPTRHGRSDSA